MGIRFYCPNGHKLNVKEFQAGRKGICPFCGSRTQIPTQSTRPSRKGRRHGTAQGGTQTLDDDGQGSDSSPDILPGEPPALPGDPAGATMVGPRIAPGSREAGPIAAPPPAGARSTGFSRPAVGNSNTQAAQVKSNGLPPKGGTTSASTSPAPTIARGSLPPTIGNPNPTQPPTAPSSSGQDARRQPPPEPSDPISEAPEMIWYIRPPSGGQFGPAPGDLMRTWLSEGRVSAESLVWREGWRDWQEAGTIFPKLRGNPLSDLLDSIPAAPSSTSPASVSTHTHRPKPHKSSDNTWIALLTIAILGLVIVISVFLYFLLK